MTGNELKNLNAVNLAPAIATGVIQWPLKTGKRFTVQTPEGVISQTGVSAIESYLYCAGFATLPESFDWVWLTRRGTLPKRIQSHFHKLTPSVKLTPAQVSELGNLGRLHSDKAKVYTLDFTQEIDWNEGDFGDGGSCFWGSNSGARKMLEQNEAYAVRGYREYRDTTRMRGYARAWIAKHDKTESPIVFNGYGETTIVFARLLALYFGCAYKRISLRNHGAISNTLYINGGQGYLLGDFSLINPIESHDLKWEEIHEYNSYCEVCDGSFDENETFEAYTRCGRLLTACGDCCEHCENCENYFTYGLTNVGRLYLCDTCADIVRREREQSESEATL